jgi:hypothetical protein
MQVIQFMQVIQLRRRRSIHYVAAAVIATTALVWQAGALAQAAPTATQSSSERGVTITVTPEPAAVDAAEWHFKVVLDTHSGQISDDLVQTAVLVIDGREFKPLQWSGAAPGGHHSEGVLAFAAPGQPVNAIELRIQRVGEAAPRVFRWDGAALR